jgi:23S rRNA pseudouridine2457 synthase
MSILVLFNKPFGVLTQFTDTHDRETLANYINIPDIYTAGRLDRDSEGLLVLTDDMVLRHRLMHPKFKQEKSYWVQVEGSPDDHAIGTLCRGVMLKDGLTAPAKARIISPPSLWERNPPIRFRAHIPTTWLEIKIKEGRNRQVRRMTAAVGFPTLRLIRFASGPWQLGNLQPGEWCYATT